MKLIIKLLEHEVVAGMKLYPTSIHWVLMIDLASSRISERPEFIASLVIMMGIK